MPEDGSNDHRNCLLEAARAAISLRVAPQPVAQAAIHAFAKPFRQGRLAAGFRTALARCGVATRHPSSYTQHVALLGILFDLGWSDPRAGRLGGVRSWRTRTWPAGKFRESSPAARMKRAEKLSRPV